MKYVKLSPLWNKGILFSKIDLARFGGSFWTDPCDHLQVLENFYEIFLEDYIVLEYISLFHRAISSVSVHLFAFIILKGGFGIFLKVAFEAASKATFM